MANSKDRDAADEMTRVPMQHAVDEWTRGVQEGLTRYQEMFSQLPGFDVNGAEVGGSVAREQLIEFNTDLLSYAQGSLNDSFEASKAVINAANMQEAMQIQIAHARKAMQDAGEQAKKLADRYAKASRVLAKSMSGGTHDAAEQARKVGLKGANETEKQARFVR